VRGGAAELPPADAKLRLKTALVWALPTRAVVMIARMTRGGIRNLGFFLDSKPSKNNKSDTIVSKTHGISLLDHHLPHASPRLGKEWGNYDDRITSRPHSIPPELSCYVLSASHAGKKGILHHRQVIL